MDDRKGDRQRERPEQEHRAGADEPVCADLGPDGLAVCEANLGRDPRGPEFLIHRDSAPCHPHLIADLQAAGAVIVLYDDHAYVLDDQLRAALDQVTSLTDDELGELLD
ncbi:MAG: hypothetical protein ACLPZR_10645 [Solirubrobacteraceae bacterium]